MRRLDGSLRQRWARGFLGRSGVALMGLAPMLVVVIGACDDAILGERLLGCDGGDCTDAPTSDAPMTDEGCAPPPSEPTCDAGTPAPTRDPAGCVVGFVCEITCASLGGSCSTRAACAGGRWATSASTDCTASGETQGCCRSCPAIALPPDGFCDAGGTMVSVTEGDCVVRFECQ